jgi:hypothetical protein
MPIEKYRITVEGPMGFLREGYADSYVDAQAIARVFTQATGKRAVISEATHGVAGWFYRNQSIEGEDVRPMQ